MVWWSNRADVDDERRNLVYEVSDPEMSRLRDRDHWPMRDDARQGRKAYICGHCGGRMTWRDGVWEGLMALATSRCFPKPGDPLSPRAQELADLDEEMGWDETRSAIEVANWATRARTTMSHFRPRGGR